MGLIVGKEVNWDGFIASVGGDEANVDLMFTWQFGFIVGTGEGEGEGGFLADDADLSFFWFFSCDFVEELDGFSGLFFNVKAERFGSDAEIESLCCPDGEY